MRLDRRRFLKTIASTLGALIGPFSLRGRKGFAGDERTPELLFLTPKEYHTIRKMSFEIIPDEPVLTGQVDVALNVDRFFAQNPSPDFLVMLKYLRLIQLAEPMFGLISKVSPATAEDILSFKKMICGLGYYSDANGEADLPPEKRIVWPRIGYGGPKPEDWFPPEKEVQLDPALLVDRIESGE